MLSSLLMHMNNASLYRYGISNRDEVTFIKRLRRKWRDHWLFTCWCSDNITDVTVACLLLHGSWNSTSHDFLCFQELLIQFSMMMHHAWWLLVYSQRLCLSCCWSISVEQSSLHADVVSASSLPVTYFVAAVTFCDISQIWLSCSSP